MKLVLRRVLLGILVTTGATLAAFAQEYPIRPISIVVGYSAGAASDTLARTLAEALQEQWGQTVVVDNRPGSGSNIAAGHVARSAPDGYTLMIATDATLTSNAFLYKSMPFDPMKDFAPVLNAAANIIVLAVHPDQPTRAVADFIAQAKSNPDKIGFGSSGMGSPHHLAGELLMQMASIKLVHVAYRGGGQTVNDLLGGHIPAAFLSLSAAKGLHDAGKIRIIAVTGKERYIELPDIPTVAETLPGFEMSSWVALVAPAGTPPSVVQRLSDASAKILKTEAISKKLAGAGLVVTASPPAELANAIREGLEVRGRLIKAVGVDRGSP
jgi:tripartite-type tricarboxylate transporter receptor subunit TctC